MAQSPSAEWNELEEQWIDELRRGELTAFEAIYKAFAPMLYSFAQRVVSADAADDVVQDVFTDVWERRATLDIHGSLKGYLFGAVWRRALNVQRNDAIRMHTVDRAVSTQETLAMGTLPAPDAETEAHEFEVALNTAVLSLPERTQLVLSLRWRDGLTYKQIAQVLGVSAAAAEKQGQRAESALRALLQRFRR